MARVAHMVLTHLPSAPESMGLDALEAATGLARKQIVMAIDRLSKRRLVAHAGHALYRRTAAGDAFIAAGATVRPGPADRGPRPLRGDHAAGRDTLRDRAWRALRQLKKATLPEILELACRGEEADPHGNVRTYLYQLLRKGIVARLSRRVPGIAQTSNGFHQWLLVRDLGPKAPVWRKRSGVLIDRNSGKPLQEDRR
jgi:hypothetical protein